MSYLVVKLPIKKHNCPTPSLYGLAAGTIWQCDGIREHIFKRRYDGCGKTYKAVEIQYSAYLVWEEIEWPQLDPMPRPPAGPSPSGRKP